MEQNDKKAEETTLDNEPTVEVLKEVKKEGDDERPKTPAVEDIPLKDLI